MMCSLYCKTHCPFSKSVNTELINKHFLVHFHVNTNMSFCVLLRKLNSTAQGLFRSSKKQDLDFNKCFKLYWNTCFEISPSTWKVFEKSLRHSMAELTTFYLFPVILFYLLFFQCYTLGTIWKNIICLSWERRILGCSQTNVRSELEVFVKLHRSAIMCIWWKPHHQSHFTWGNSCTV